MLEFAVSPEMLARLLLGAGDARLRAARCAIEGSRLVLRLEGVDTGLSAMGRSLPRVDVEVFLTARRLSETILEGHLELGKIGGIPSFAARLLPRAKITAKLIDLLTSQLELEECTEELADGLMRIHLDRLPLGARPFLAGLRCRELAVPTADGLACRAVFALG